MTENSAQFPQARRGGYEPAPVDHYVRDLSEQLAAAKRQSADLARRVDALQLEATELQQKLAGSTGYAGLGDRIEKIILLAEAEAAELRAQADRDLEQLRTEAEGAIAKHRAEADRYAFSRRGDADAEAKKRIEDAKADADRIRDEAERDAAARRAEAEALYESQKAKAAAAASDFETTLAQRRELAEHDFTERTAAAEGELLAVQNHAEQLRLESEKLRADAERKSARHLEESERRAREIVAEAQARADKISAESARELAAATQRRDSINSQLTNVRQMLATLGGGGLPAALTEAQAGPEPTAAQPAADLMEVDVSEAQPEGEEGNVDLVDDESVSRAGPRT
jgi:hypothetical protein